MPAGRVGPPQCRCAVDEDPARSRSRRASVVVTRSQRFLPRRSTRSPRSTMAKSRPGPQDTGSLGVPSRETTTPRAPASVEHVPAAEAVEVILPRGAGQHVRSTGARHRVLEAAAADVLDLGDAVPVAGQARAAGARPEPGCSRPLVGVRDRVETRAAEQPIRARAAQGVVAGCALEHIRSRPAAQGI